MELPRHVASESVKPGDKVAVAGWVRSKRDSKKWSFLSINDGSCLESLQLIVPVHESFAGILGQLGTGASIHVAGLLKASPGAGQSLEVEVTDLKLLGAADPTQYPLQKKAHSFEFLREQAHLRGRTNTFGAVFRIRNHLAFAVHEFFQKRGFVLAHTPILTSSDCEGAGELFRVGHEGTKASGEEFFGRPAFLTVSGQLEAEFLALSLGDVYTFGPTFRAENSNTTRHLAEFWMVEPEMAFAELGDVMNLAEDFLRAVVKSALESCEPELLFLAKQWGAPQLSHLEALASKEPTRLTYTEAVAILEKAPQKFEYPPRWGHDLQTEHERYLAEEVVSGPLFVTNYPKDIKAFYMRLDDDGRTVAAMDLLVPGIGELIGGSQREERLDYLQNRLAELALATPDLDWYLDLRRYGSVPHGGFGLGFERLVMLMTGMSNIRDVVMAPRTPGQIAF